MKQACTKPVTFKICRHSDFGQAGWAREEVVNGSTGGAAVVTIKNLIVAI